ncbi:thrombospondin type 3 repeat-containing protein [Ramlibacter sp. USB13]|uniref:Thrombospondin type 3 repeat-containing protein n=1 Tax=Ramlibacter cellulosilyticus TaxID=2764187 RepID=A0A923SBT0_9BURK|nr:thrombospondin type 3 repeat-containing protein [Ramlibacter cellulosilyticus]MBC5784195.1 thrombospondin type 3 repeat-containing protein [Ramlibacter cellulosilyticus]
MRKTSWMTLAGAAALMVAFAAPAHAGASVHVQIGTPYYPAYSQPGYVVTGPQYYQAPRPYHYGHGYQRSHRRDQDRDGIPNRWDRDRDGDGVPNRWDRRPTNPYRR